MSYHDAIEADCRDCDGAVALIIRPREKDLGEMTVRRVLPARERQMVGPFIFFDHMGPADFPPGTGIKVRPHPHIGLATITYLFEGGILHRDSLGYVQSIEPGAVNLMTAGRGIVHSERENNDLDKHVRLHGIQSWMALPEGQQECEPEFRHYPAQTIPTTTIDGSHVSVIVGTAWGLSSPVETRADMVYAELRMPAGCDLTLPSNAEELAIYVVDGSIQIGAESVGAGEMAVLNNSSEISVRATQDAHAMLIGGEPMGARKLAWNFVALTDERIAQAREDWRQGRYDLVPGDDERIPFPGDD